MKQNLLIAAALLITRAWTADCVTAKVSEPAVYSGMCDASAAVALTDTLFAVASDEDSVIRIYSRAHGGPPAQSFDLATLLDLDTKKPETDLEGSARVGSRVYWITSHGRNKGGKERLSRERFFATQITTNLHGVQLKLIGKPYEHLLRDLIHDPRLKRFNLAAAAQLEPKARGALNIEGLSATPEGHLLIGFRNPIPGGKALIVPLLNPDEVVRGKTARLGEPILLDLDGLGIRDMAVWNEKYLVAAGSFDGKGASHLYEWPGGSAKAQRVKHAHLNGLNPEAIIFYPDKGWEDVQVLSDDGRKLVNGKPCKECPPNKQQFRSVWVKP